MTASDDEDRTVAPPRVDLNEVEMSIADRQAVELRRDGKSYRQIADALDVSLSSAHRMVNRAMKAIVLEPAETVKKLELERFDRMIEQLETIIQNATAKDADMTVLMAQDRLLRVSAERRKLLGADSPVKIEHRMVDALDAQLEQLAMEVGALADGTSIDRDDVVV